MSYCFRLFHTNRSECYTLYMGLTRSCQETSNFYFSDSYCSKETKPCRTAPSSHLTVPLTVVIVSWFFVFVSYEVKFFHFVLARSECTCLRHESYCCRTFISIKQNQVLEMLFYYVPLWTTDVQRMWEGFICFENTKLQVRCVKDVNDK